MTDETTAMDENGAVLCPCPNCTARHAESLTLRARVRLLDAALAYPEMTGPISHHARALVGMLRARGWA